MKPELDEEDDPAECISDIAFTMITLMTILVLGIIYLVLVPAWLSAHSDTLMYLALGMGIVGVCIPILWVAYVLKPWLKDRGL